MLRRLTTLIIVLTFLLTLATPASAITFGEPDGNAHPNVGSIVLFRPNMPLMQWCSGTLIAPDVYLTAGHCVRRLQMWLDLYEIPFGIKFKVTFDPVISESSTYYSIRQTVVHPQFAQDPSQEDSYDVGLLLLDQAPVGISPAMLPAAGLLDQLKDQHILKDTRFTTVGYGDIRDTIRYGNWAMMENLERNRVEQGFLALTNAWLVLSMNSSTGDGGVGMGDSGGPHFIHMNGVETNIIASITVKGDMVSKAMDKSYRMDTENARSFLGQYVTLP